MLIHVFFERNIRNMYLFDDYVKKLVINTNLTNELSFNEIFMN